MASQSTLRVEEKLPPTMRFACVVVLLYTLIAPLSPDQLEPVVAYVTMTCGMDVNPAPP